MNAIDPWAPLTDEEKKRIPPDEKFKGRRPSSRVVIGPDLDEYDARRAAQNKGGKA